MERAVVKTRWNYRAQSNLINERYPPYLHIDRSSVQLCTLAFPNYLLVTMWWKILVLSCQVFHFRSMEGLQLKLVTLRFVGYSSCVVRSKKERKDMIGNVTFGVFRVHMDGGKIHPLKLLVVLNRCFR